eukprot:scpid107391/ scgid11330/ 
MIVVLGSYACTGALYQQYFVSSIPLPPPPTTTTTTATAATTASTTAHACRLQPDCYFCTRIKQGVSFITVSQREPHLFLTKTPTPALTKHDLVIHRQSP